MSFAGFDVYNLANQEILARNFHWSERIRNDKDFQNRADPEKLLDLEKEKSKKNGQSQYRPSLRNNFGFHNPFPENLEHLIYNELFCPGLAPDSTLERFLNNSKKTVLIVAGQDPLHDDGAMFARRLTSTAVGRRKKQDGSFVFEDFSGAQHIFYMSSALTNPKLGYEFYDAYVVRMLEHLSLVK